MSKRMDPDLRGLKETVRGLERTQVRMRRPTLEYLWDRYVTNPRVVVAGSRPTTGKGSAR